MLNDKKIREENRKINIRGSIMPLLILFIYFFRKFQNFFPKIIKAIWQQEEKSKKNSIFRELDKK